MDWGSDTLSGIWIYLFPLIIIWSMVWKGVALWKAARNNHLVWYIVLLVVNTMGILEIIYIFAFAKKKKIEVISSPVNQKEKKEK